MNKNITIERVKAAAALQGHRLSYEQAIELIGIAQDGYAEQIETETIEQCIEFLDDNACEHSGQLHNMPRLYKGSDVI